MIQFRENNFVPFFQIKYDYIKYVHVTCVELWFVFFFPYQKLAFGGE